jgi:hypothetical protein
MPDELRKKVEEVKVQKLGVTKEIGEHKATLKKRKRDEALAISNIELLKKNMQDEIVKKAVNLPLILQYKEAISGNWAILQGVREAILVEAASIKRGQKILTDMDKWIEIHEDELDQYGKVIPFDRNRSQTPSKE